MLADCKAITPIAVNDLENAIYFYGEILGLKEVGRSKAGFTFVSEGSFIGLHESPSAGSGQATCLWWTVSDVETTAKELKVRGIELIKNYDLPYAKRVDDVYLLDNGTKAVWFKDPDGNILGLGDF